LDGEGQEALTKAVALAKQRGATVVIVAHQPQLMRVCDKMLVLQGGVIKKYGPRDEVMSQVVARKASVS
jgi:ABC-type protease/lipase transport system fused ATPase/permease subunit